MGQGPTLDEHDDGNEASPLTPLGEFMLRRNAELGLSVSAVAQRVGMSRATWYRMARGESTSPGMRLLRGLARVYRVRPDELFALAAYGDPALGPAPAQARATPGRPGPDAGDALWRCRHEPRARPGSWLAVELELLNLSGLPWNGAEIRPVHDEWLSVHPTACRTPDRLLAAEASAPGSARLPPTGPGEWVRTGLTLRAPEVIGHWLWCLTLHRHPDRASHETHAVAAPRQGYAGAIVYLETR